MFSGVKTRMSPRRMLRSTMGRSPSRPALKEVADVSNLPVAIAGFSVAGVGLIAGAITGGLSLSTAGDIDEMCMPNCPESFRDDYDTGLALAHVSTVSFAVAGAGAVVGVVGLLLPGPAVGGDRAQLRVGPGSLSLQGRF